MTKTHYTSLARVLSKNLRYIPAKAFRKLVDDISTVLEEDNPNFDREKFLNASIGLPETTPC